MYLRMIGRVRLLGVLNFERKLENSIDHQNTTDNVCTRPNLIITHENWSTSILCAKFTSFYGTLYKIRLLIIFISLHLNYVLYIVKVKLSRCLLCSIELQFFHSHNFPKGVHKTELYSEFIFRKFIQNIYWTRHEVINITELKHIANSSANIIPHAISFMNFSMQERLWNQSTLPLSLLIIYSTVVKFWN